MSTDYLKTNCRTRQNTYMGTLGAATVLRSAKLEKESRSRRQGGSVVRLLYTETKRHEALNPTAEAC